jgi:hypothetical protein
VLLAAATWLLLMAVAWRLLLAALLPLENM